MKFWYAYALKARLLPWGKAWSVPNLHVIDIIRDLSEKANPPGFFVHKSERKIRNYDYFLKPSSKRSQVGQTGVQKSRVKQGLADYGDLHQNVYGVLSVVPSVWGGPSCYTRGWALVSCKFRPRLQHRQDHLLFLPGLLIKLTKCPDLRKNFLITLGRDKWKRA